MYLSGQYAAKHEDWHLADAPGKVEDLLPVLAAVMASPAIDKTFRLADIGCGVGGVLAETVKRLNALYQEVEVVATGFEISPAAVETGRELFPHLDIRQKFFEPGDGDFEAVMFIDVLEHLENPWALLRAARETGRFMIVRQPLEENFSTFRYRNYQNQREHWGHIQYFNYHSFLDIAAATGWKPFNVELRAGWELTCNKTKRVSPVHHLMVKVNRSLASYVLSGFYLIGAFVRK